MNIKQLNQLPIQGFLGKIGIEPSYQRGENLWYISPVREPENSPSFKVNTSMNRWYDYGTLQGGKLFDLAEKLNPELDTSGVIEKVNSLFFFEQQHQNVRTFVQPIQQSVTDGKHNPSAILIREVKALGSNRAITDYLESRGISVQVARPYCKEVDYQISDKGYFAVGFQNRSGGYELRSPYFKGSSSPKDITLIQNGNRSVCVLEGFMDFLSLLTLQHKQHPIKSDFLVLNSVSLVERSLDVLKGYHNVFMYLDRDKAGKQALEKYQLAGLSIVDVSRMYLGFKDLNDYLMDQKSRQQELKQQQTLRQSKGMHI